MDFVGKTKLLILNVWLSQCKRTGLLPLQPGFDTWRWHVRWSCGHQVRQVGFLRVLQFPPTRRPSERKHRCQRA